MQSRQPQILVNYLANNQRGITTDLEKIKDRTKPDEVVYSLRPTHPTGYLLSDETFDALKNAHGDSRKDLTQKELTKLFDIITQSIFPEIFDVTRGLSTSVTIKQSVLEALPATCAIYRDPTFLLRACSYIMWHDFVLRLYNDNRVILRPIKQEVNPVFFEDMPQNYFHMRFQQLTKNPTVAYTASPKSRSDATPLCKGDIAAISTTVLFAIFSILEAPLFLLLLIPIGALFYSRHQHGNYFFDKRASSSSAMLNREDRSVAHRATM